MKALECCALRAIVMLASMSPLACDVPECIDGPSNLTPEATAECVAPPENTEPETDIVSASAQIRGDGTMVLTWSSRGLACGVTALEVPFPGDCQITGWTMTAEIPAELAVEGLIELSEHPEIIGSLSTTSGQDGIARKTYDETQPFFVGAIELVNVGESCVTGVLHGFGTGDPDPVLGGPELDGSFVAPRC